MSVKFKPLADRVLVEPAPAEQKTASGIIIPDTAKEKPLNGKIVAVGSGKKDDPSQLKLVIQSFMVNIRELKLKLMENLI